MRLAEIPERRGFTLVDIADFGVLAALSLSAEQSARDSVRNASCKKKPRIRLLFAAAQLLIASGFKSSKKTTRPQWFDEFRQDVFAIQPSI